jgi:hypothetical protein
VAENEVELVPLINAVVVAVAEKNEEVEPVGVDERVFDAELVPV